jgi:biopolymer transport protein ExbD
MTMNSDAGRRVSSEINVTPLIDVLLVLLIIFMVIVPVIPKGDNAMLPAPAGLATSPNKPLVLEVTGRPDGSLTYRLNQVVVKHADLAGKLSDIFRTRADRDLFIQGDDQVAFSHIADAIDIGHAAGAENVGLLTPGTGR